MVPSAFGDNIFFRKAHPLRNSMRQPLAHTMIASSIVESFCHAYRQRQWWGSDSEEHCLDMSVASLKERPF